MSMIAKQRTAPLEMAGGSLTIPKDIKSEIANPQAFRQILERDLASI